MKIVPPFPLFYWPFYFSLFFLALRILIRHHPHYKFRLRYCLGLSGFMERTGGDVMKRLAQWSVVGLAWICLTGCAMYRPQSFWETTVSSADLSQKNFKVRKLGAQGSASTPYLFGLPMGASICGIPLYRQDIQARAMRDLHRNWDGRGSCFLHNVNVEWSNYGIPAIFIIHQNTITADIYEFDREFLNYKTPVVPVQNP